MRQRGQRSAIVPANYIKQLDKHTFTGLWRVVRRVHGQTFLIRLSPPDFA
jgi:hypothetical protein